MTCSRLLAAAAGAVAAAALSGCSGGSTTDSPGSALNPESLKPAELSAKAKLGKELFSDTALSASGQQACATCHVPDHAYAADDGAAVPLGGPDMDLPGFRNAPSLMYASYSPRFHFDEEGTPRGGFFRDGRAASLAQQAMQPFVTPFEMANAGADDVLARLRQRPYVQAFEQVFGADALTDPDSALGDIGQAIAAFEREARDFRPFSSKFDAFQRGKAALTARELAGLALFNDPTKGNCAACHVSTSADGVTPPLFTDFTYDNLGVPRNAALAVNDDATTLPYVPANGNDGVHRFYDLGLCGPFGDTGTRAAALCGQFKVPTLRNIARTAPYFHNGEFQTLEQAVGFYVRRDTRPNEWYPDAPGGNTDKFDDLPYDDGGAFLVNAAAPGTDAGYVGNVNTSEVPYDRHIGEGPRLDEDELLDLVAFLCTLTDGYDPSASQRYPWPAQCLAAEPSPDATP